MSGEQMLTCGEEFLDEDVVRGRRERSTGEPNRLDASAIGLLNDCLLKFGRQAEDVCWLGRRGCHIGEKGRLDVDAARGAAVLSGEACGGCVELFGCSSKIACCQSRVSRLAFEEGTKVEATSKI